ncbi:DUF3500 domain-containing protein [Lunatibacter salilacus]|uniref:DUF3500 domain-containing protein n=1 Tax=Lunatibacter salilacus TaxID=2483804 RepID=UPI00131B6601|nr:DUF3500 domain-containing protein [Lunatibacter salilacus]
MYSNPKVFFLALFSILCVQFNGFGQDLSGLANDFIKVLPEELKHKASFPFDHSERFNWHFIPRDRKGITFHDMNENQTKAALSLMRASLSEQGEEKAKAIFELENVLRIVENRPPNDTYRDPLNYYFSIFGDPSSTKEWGWRLEGHHLSLNFSSLKGELISATPTFFGSNPAIVQVDLHRGKQVLKKETDMGFAFLQSLDDSQSKIAVYTDKAPGDILTSNDRKATLQNPKGIGYNQLNANQKKMLEELVHYYLSNYNSETRDALWEKVKSSGLDELYFAWAGSQVNEIGQPHYYRIQCPAILIEYDNVQNNANHVHTVVRDLTNDFGDDILGNHYTNGHSHASE